MAALLRDFAGLKTGDRVTIHLPMTPELPITMLACARLGVIHSVVFGGFSGEAAGMRAADSGCRVLVTMDGYWRSGKIVDHKAAADLAVAAAKKEGQVIDKVLIWRRFKDKIVTTAAMVEGRDFILNDKLKEYAGKRVAPVSMPAEAPLFLMYTSGTTESQRAVNTPPAAYLAYVTGHLEVHSGYSSDRRLLVHGRYRLDHRRFWYIVYGPLALAATSVRYEGVPTFPDAGRPWRIAERLGVNIFHTSPTAIRMLRKLGPDEPRESPTITSST